MELAPSLDGVQYAVTGIDEEDLRAKATSTGTTAGVSLTSFPKISLEKILGTVEATAVELAAQDGVLMVDADELHADAISSSIWVGTDWCLRVDTAGISGADLSDFVARIERDENETGLVVTLPDEFVWDLLPDVVASFPEFGLLQAYRKGDPQAPQLPAWPGTKSTGGAEVFREPLNSDLPDHSFFVLRFDDCIASVVPGGPDDQVIDAIDQLMVALAS